MKIKADHVTNSSSTCFVITNNTNKKLTLVDFVKENPQLIEEFNEMYGYEDQIEYCQEGMVISARQENITFEPHSSKKCVFGDEQGTLIGNVFDYILRDGGNSKSFSWRFHEYYR